MAFRGQNPEGPFSYPNGASGLNANTCVTIDGSGNLKYAGATDRGLGYILNAAAANATSVTVFGMEGEAVLVAGAAGFTKGDLVRVAANGAVVVEASAHVQTADTIGIALSTAASGELGLIKFY